MTTLLPPLEHEAASKPALDMLCHALFDASPTAYRVVDADGRCVLQNASFVALFGAISADDAARVPENDLTRALTGELVRSCATQLLVHPSATPVDFELELIPLAMGGEIRHVAIAYHPLETRKPSREPTTRQVLDRRLDRLEFVLQHMPIACQITDPSFCTVFVNTATERLLGFTASELIGTNPFGSVVPEDEAARLRERFARIACGESPPSTLGEARTKDGRIITAIWHTTPLFDRHGRFDGILTMGIDVTERLRAEDELTRIEAQAKQVREANRLKSEFLASMSHELRTPLNAVLGFAEMIADRVVAPESAEHDEFIGHILMGGQHLLKLINEVLDLAKVEAGKLELSPERVALPKLVEEVKQLLHSKRSAHSVPIAIQLDPTLPELFLDPARLKQVLYNYLSNAQKFSPAGGTVTVRARPEGADAFRLEVEDRGDGIALADQERLFVEFQQLEAMPGKLRGTGLGLALTKRLVEAQGGRVGVDSAPGQGSTFFVVLPLRVE